MAYFGMNELIELTDGLNYCCKYCQNIFKCAHNVMNYFYYGEESNSPLDPCKYFMINRLNHMGFLKPGTSIYNSYATEKGEELIEVLDEMKKYGYDYVQFMNKDFAKKE